MTTDLVYPEAVPSLNKLLRQNKHEYKRRREMYRWLFRSQTTNQHPGKVRLEVIRMGLRDLDYDNLVGAAKPMIDALVLAKIITGDTTKIITERDYQQVRAADKTQCRTIIRIFDLP